MSGPGWRPEGGAMREREGNVEAFGSTAPELAIEGREDESTPEALMVFEGELGQALRPIDLPADFAERIAARAAAATTPVQAPKQGRLLPFQSRRWVTGGAIAASLLAGSLVFEQAHQRQVRAHAAAVANQQFETATRITEETLERTRAQLRRAGVPAVE